MNRLPQRRDMALREAVLAITASLDLDRVLSEIAHRCAQLVHGSAGLIYLLDNSSNLLELAAGSHLSIPGPTLRATAGSHRSPRVTLGLGQGSAGRAAAAGRAILIEDYPGGDDRPDRFKTAAPFGVDRPVHSLISIPLIYSGDVLGVLEVVSAETGGIPPEDADLLETLAPHAAIAIAHARLFERSREMLNLMQTVNDRNAAVSSVSQSILDAGHDLHRMLADALQRVMSLLSLKAGSILLANPAGRELHVVVHFGFPQDNGVLATRQRIGAAEPGLAARTALEGQPIVVRDVEGDPLTRPALEALRRFGIGAMAGLPLMAGDTVVGVLLVGSENDKTLDAGTLDTLRIIAGEMALGVSNARLFSRVRSDQEQLEAVITSSSDVVFSLDRQGRVTLANEAAQQAFGFDVKDAIGQPLSQATTNVALNSAVEQAVRLETRERIGFEVPLADESILFCNLSPITDQDEQVMGWVAVMQDITRFKEAERMRSDMILTASHDLRNPVNLTLGALDMLGKAAETWEPIQRELFELAVIGARRVEALIADLLDLERVERRVGLRLRECDLSEIARTVVTELRMQAQSKQQTLEDHLPAELPPVWGDSQRLYQVISNLVSNAIKYTLPAGRITLNLHREDDHILLEVSDTGVGIPKEAQARVFERFYRVAGSASIDATGTGLGLALVKTIVEQHGGQVWVTSQVGHGSTFSVSLPVWRPPATDDQPSSPSLGVEVKP
jgi:PAS domain S-box-containing protein